MTRLPRLLACPLIGLLAAIATPTVAGASPSRVACEIEAKNVANVSGYPPGSKGWMDVRNEVYLSCMAGLTVMPHVTPIPASFRYGWWPTDLYRFLLRLWVLS